MYIFSRKFHHDRCWHYFRHQQIVTFQFHYFTAAFEVMLCRHGLGWTKSQINFVGLSFARWSLCEAALLGEISVLHFGKGGDHGPLIVTANLADSRLQKKYLIIPQWSRLRSGSQIFDCDCRLCDDYACNCFLHRPVVFYRTAVEQPGNFRYANIFQMWIAMGNQSDNKLGWNGDNYIVLRFMVPTLQDVEIIMVRKEKKNPHFCVALR